jgi:hypothetical protein
LDQGERRERKGTEKRKKRKGKIVGPTVGRVGWRPPKMEAGRGDLEKYAKWRLV